MLWTNHIASHFIPESNEWGILHRLLKRYDVTPVDLCNLCGGLPSSDTRFTEVSYNIVSTDSCEFQIVTNRYHVTRRIDFSHKIVDNHHMEVFAKGNGIGTSLFINQVRTAAQLGFRKISLFAAGPEYGPEYDGYVFWGKFGFLMADINDREDFLEWANYLNYPETDLGQLLLYGEEGAWRLVGFSWSGTFDLAPRSKSWQQLHQYLQIKGLLWMMDQA